MRASLFPRGNFSPTSSTWRLIPGGAAVLNDCSDRYHFAVGLAAAFMADRVSLLPPTHTPEVVRQIRAMTPEAICLTDHRNCGIDLPLVFFRRSPRRAPGRGGYH